MFFKFLKTEQAKDKGLDASRRVGKSDEEFLLFVMYRFKRLAFAIAVKQCWSL